MGTGPTNYQVQQLLTEMAPRAKQSPFWRRVSDELTSPRRSRRVVNLYKIEEFARDGETILVPGKVLSVGELHKKVDVAALTFSTEARSKISSAKGKVLSIRQLLQQNPDGKKVRILG